MVSSMVDQVYLATSSLGWKQLELERELELEKSYGWDYHSPIRIREAFSGLARETWLL